MFEEIAKQAILNRLFQAIIREKIIQNEKIFYPNKNCIAIKLSQNKELFAEINPYASFERFDLTSTITLIDKNETKEISHPCDLLQLFQEEWIAENNESEDIFIRFKNEIENSVSNMILAQMSFEMNKNKFSHKNWKRITSSLDWVLIEREKDPNFSPMAFYEQCVIKGHPLHPGAKTRMGLNLEELIAYSPEWRKIVPLKLLAVHKDYCKVTLQEFTHFRDLILADYPNFSNKILLEAEKNKIDFQNYELIPVHPWQFKHTIKVLYQKYLNEKIIVPLNSIEIPARSLVSFRSFAPENTGKIKRHHIKTAINILTTSDVRTISPRSTQSGPLISQILKTIQLSLPDYLCGKFKIQGEVSGIYFEESSELVDSIVRDSLGRNLSCLMRENPEKFLSGNEICMPAAALLEISPISEKSILTELIEQFAKTENHSSFYIAALEFFKKYISISIPSLLTLMSKYGISLEAHLQNSTPVFKKGVPHCLLVRDFADIRISQERLEKQNYFLNLTIKNSLIFCKNDSYLHKNIFYSFFQSHIGEIIIALRKEFNIDEKILWNYVKELCQNTFAELKKDPIIAEQVGKDEKFLFQENIQLKALTRMRLKGELTEYYFVNIANPIP
ncbi:IucA/IucC family protein [Fluviispira sanaruensis]|uniref:Siderophore biosynthesis protein IucA n=1 Tax=Fluviispira sanaruensis TaxID=2493639 RepID=A0A4P2VVI7_FLUSA|nr:IucA/IucC family protein [Fluviispira sanaruensis]BBH53555.1 siderophore biosynthesis protein IucA [Fluviispira sanaruensis]